MQCVSPPSNLVSWWPGDGNAGDIVSGNNGALKNGVTFGTGIIGQAFSLNGVNQFVLVWIVGLHSQPPNVDIHHIAVAVKVHVPDLLRNQRA